MYRLVLHPFTHKEKKQTYNQWWFSIAACFFTNRRVFKTGDMPRKNPSVLGSSHCWWPAHSLPGSKKQDGHLTVVNDSLSMVNIWLLFMVIIWLIMVNHNLVGGIPTPLKNMSSSVGMMNFPIYGKNHVPNHQPVPLLWFVGYVIAIAQHFESQFPND